MTFSTVMNDEQEVSFVQVDLWINGDLAKTTYAAKQPTRPAKPASYDCELRASASRNRWASV
jgi:hypothetical protein